MGFFTKDCLKAHCGKTEVMCDIWYGSLTPTQPSSDIPVIVEQQSKIRTWVVTKLHANASVQTDTVSIAIRLQTTTHLGQGYLILVSLYIITIDSSHVFSSGSISMVIGCTRLNFTPDVTNKC